MSRVDGCFVRVLSKRLDSLRTFEGISRAVEPQPINERQIGDKPADDAESAVAEVPSNIEVDHAGPSPCRSPEEIGGESVAQATTPGQGELGKSGACTGIPVLWQLGKQVRSPVQDWTNAVAGQVDLKGRGGRAGSGLMGQNGRQ
ncbi:MAG: hypothetical protein OXN91_07445, partial [Chloroflexota bacterium]|nr:hypothetical protein [Chloroflexota bacterium]